MVKNTPCFNSRSNNVHWYLMRGLCHNCLSSGVELITSKGNILCQKCFDKSNAKN